MKKLVIFTGAGVSQQSDIPTFRCPKEGIYKDVEIEKMITASHFTQTPTDVFNFCNYFRDMIRDKRPNEAHNLIVKLEKEFDVTIITTNIDDLHEQAGSDNVLHLHGELHKARPYDDPLKMYRCPGDLKYGDKSPDGELLRPHVVLFEEMPYNVNNAYNAIDACDILVIVGTSLSIGYITPMLGSVKEGTKVYYVDPKPARDLEFYMVKPDYIKKDAISGMKILYKKLLKELK